MTGWTDGDGVQELHILYIVIVCSDSDSIYSDVQCTRVPFIHLLFPWVGNNTDAEDSGKSEQKTFL